MKFINFLKIFFISLLLFALCACEKANIENNKINSFDYIKVEKPLDSNFKTFHGFVKSQLISALSFQTEGRIIFMPYTKGDFIKKGQVLARLDGILYKIKKNEEQATLQNAIIQYNKSKSTFRRMDILHKEGAISDNDWEDAYFDLKSYDEQIKIQREKIRYLDKEISFNIITAPYDGFIVQKNAEVGGYAKIGEPVLIFSGSNKTQVEVMVDSSIINKINLDEKVQLLRNDETYEGKIAHISRTSLNEGGYLVKIYLNELYENLKDGMSIDVKIPFDENNIVYIPLNSIFESDGQKYVYKIDNIKNNIGEIKKQKVTTGEILDEKIEIIEGLKPDDYIITNSLDKIYENKKIKI